jgi:hypothetical protein
VGNITVAGNTTVSSSLFVEKIVESLSTVVVGSDNTATIDYAASPSIVYLNVDGTPLTTNRVSHEHPRHIHEINCSPLTL